MSTQNFEEMVSLYHNINLYCGIGALVFLAIAVFLFFWMKIPRVFGDLTGRTAQKAIAEMIAENALSGSLTSVKIGEDGRRYRRGRTGALPTGRLRKNTGSLNLSNPSGSLKTDQLAQAQDANVLLSGQYNPQKLCEQDSIQPTESVDTYGSQPTDVLDNYGSQPTDVLNNCGSQPMTQMADMASAVNSSAGGPVYQEPKSETMVLNQSLMTGNQVFVIERSIVEIHTDEVI